MQTSNYFFFFFFYTNSTFVCIPGVRSLGILTSKKTCKNQICSCLKSVVVKYGFIDKEKQDFIVQSNYIFSLLMHFKPILKNFFAFFLNLPSFSQRKMLLDNAIMVAYSE